MLKVSELHKNFDDHIIYNGFNLDINKGEIFALIGPNGIGKTSLIRMILGLDRDYLGNIDYNGFKIGYSPETPSFPEILTAMEFLELIKIISSKILKTIRTHNYNSPITYTFHIPK